MRHFHFCCIPSEVPVPPAKAGSKPCKTKRRHAELKLGSTNFHWIQSLLLCFESRRTAENVGTSPHYIRFRRQRGGAIWRFARDVLGLETGCEWIAVSG